MRGEWIPGGGNAPRNGFQISTIRLAGATTGAGTGGGGAGAAGAGGRTR